MPEDRGHEIRFQRGTKREWDVIHAQGTAAFVDAGDARVDHNRDWVGAVGRAWSDRDARHAIGESACDGGRYGPRRSYDDRDIDLAALEQRRGGAIGSIARRPSGEINRHREAGLPRHDGVRAGPIPAPPQRAERTARRLVECLDQE